MSSFEEDRRNGENGHRTRSIAIIGGGPTGLGFLKAFLDLPGEARRGWTIACFERRSEIGGIWNPQPFPPDPPTIPETPTYDQLESITAGSGLTFPGRPFPPSTNLYPNGQAVHKYYVDFVRDSGMTQYIQYNHSITSAHMTDPSDLYSWTLNIATESGESTRRFSNVIVATGITPIPRTIRIAGQETWLQASPQRQIIHSMWYRRPDFAKGKVVIVLGNRPSGAHIAKAMVGVAREVYHSFSPGLELERFPPITSSQYHEKHCRIAHLDNDSVIWEDGTVLPTPSDAIIILCTGYQRVFPVLDERVIRPVDGTNFAWDDPDNPLECNTRYIRPLVKYMLPLDTAIPRGSLLFGCLFPVVFNLPASYAQGLWYFHMLANLDVGVDMQPTLQEQSREVRSMEKEMASKGADLAREGYLLEPIGQSTDDYLDALIDEIRSLSKFDLPEWMAKRRYVEPWRRRLFDVGMDLLEVWLVAKERGVGESFSKGCKSESDFAAAIEKLVTYGRDQGIIREG